MTRAMIWKLWICLNSFFWVEIGKNLMGEFDQIQYKSPNSEPYYRSKPNLNVFKTNRIQIRPRFLSEFQWTYTFLKHHCSGFVSPRTPQNMGLFENCLASKAFRHKTPEYPLLWCHGIGEWCKNMGIGMPPDNTFDATLSVFGICNP